MQRSHGGVVVGYGDDVLQMLDAIAATEVGRHRQVQALLKGDEDVDRPLLVDECELVMADESLPTPVRDCAAKVLRSLGIDPDTIRSRVDAGVPSTDRLHRADALRAARREASRRADELGDRAKWAATRSRDALDRWRRSKD